MIVFRYLIKAQLEWGPLLFLVASKFLFRKLAYVRNTALKVVLNCMRTPPIVISLYINSGGQDTCADVYEN